MKKGTGAPLLVVLILLSTMSACNRAPDNNAPQAETASTVSTTANSTIPSTPDTESDKTDTISALYPTEDPIENLVIQVGDGTNVITYQLNGSKAAKELYEQLPLSLEVENYSNNEKIFYPPKALDISDAPKAGGDIEILAYFEPWADVVMFFGSYRPGGSLYELGKVTSDSEQIPFLEGTIKIEAVP